MATRDENASGCLRKLAGEAGDHGPAGEHLRGHQLHEISLPPVGNVPGIKALNSGGSYVGYAAGGAVKGTANSDFIHAMLKSGEFILKREAVQRISVKALTT